MKKTLSILRFILPHLLVFAVILAPTIVFAADPATAAAPTVPTDTFVPLNPIPGIIEAGNAPSLPVFFNGLYKICIGAAATIAVLQLMRAGFLFMVNKGSVSHNEQAKSIITNSVLGLVLVLSPAIVFGIINPKILNLSLDVTALQPIAPTPAGQFIGADAVLWTTTGGDKAADAKRCAYTKGTIEYRCTKGTTYRAIGASDTCASGETSSDVCKAPSNSTDSGDSCIATYADKYDFKILPIAGNADACAVSKGSIAVPHGCCVGSNPIGYACCAQPKAVPKYLVAFYAIQKTKGVATCYLPAVEFDVDQATCQATLNKYSSRAQDSTFDKPVIVKSCVLTTDQSYTVPAPNGLPDCSK
jgi:hypothetical protein